METGRYYIEATDKKLLEVLSHITNDEIKTIHQVCERYGNETSDVRYYDVYLVETNSGSSILKQTSSREAFNYENYLKGKNFATPIYYGKWQQEDETWILIENVMGEDLRDMTNELAIIVADRLAEIQNEYWRENAEGVLLRKTNDRFNAYWTRILKRANSIEENSKIKKAYQIFLDRQKTCPCALSNGDLLQFNIIQNNQDITILDWGFGGLMPYSLDIARFIAHATETRSTFPFYISDEQKRIFVERVYDKLIQKPDYDQYLYDIELAILNEYIEFVEANEDEDNWYYDHAVELAELILSNTNQRK